MKRVRALTKQSTITVELTVEFMSTILQICLFNAMLVNKHITWPVYRGESSNVQMANEPRRIVEGAKQPDKITKMY